MELNKKEELFERTPIKIAVAKLAIPTMIASVVMVIYNLADTFFVGMLNDPLATSAVTLAAPVILLFNAVTNLFGVGSSSKMSRALGIKDFETVKRTSSFGLYCTIGCGLLFSLIMTFFKVPLINNVLGADKTNFLKTSDYLFWTVSLGAIPSMLNVVMSNMFRSEGSSIHASIGVMSGCILNIILDPIFILPSGLNMGAAGAGCATFISNCVACTYFLVLYFVKKKTTFVCLNIKYALVTNEISKEVFAVGIPASIQNILNVIGSTILNNLMTVYGPEAVSAIGITHKLAMVPLYFSMGGGQGIMPLIGYNYSAKNNKRVKEVIDFTERAVVISMSIAAGFFSFFAKELVLIFMDNELVVEYGTIFMKAFSLAIPFLAYDFIGVAVFQACGNGKMSLIFALARKLVLEIPAYIVLNKILGINGVAYGQLIAEATLALIAYFVLRDIKNPKKAV